MDLFFGNEVVGSVLNYVFDLRFTDQDFNLDTPPSTLDNIADSILGRYELSMGMHIVFNLVVQKLGGRIECESEPGQGVKFMIEVPV